MDSRLPNSKNNLNIQAGNVCFAVSCTDRDILQRLKLVYNDFLCDRIADILVELEIVENMSLKMAYERSKNFKFKHNDSTFSDGGELVWGKYDLSSKKVYIRTEKALLMQSCDRFYLNQIICKLYYTAFKIRGLMSLPSLIVHSSAVAFNDYGILFTGPSGIGKTTAATMYSDDDSLIINDEGNLVSRPSITGSEIKVQGIPIIGKISERRNLTVPLLCILFLKQSTETEFHIVNKTDAFKRLMRQVVGNLYLGQDNRKEVYSSNAEFCEEVVQHVPCYELEFTLESSQLKSALNSLKNSLLKERIVYG